MKSSTVTQKGQVTIPKEFRDAFGWSKDTKVAFLMEEDGVKIITSTKSASEVIARMKKTRWNGPSADELMDETRSEV